MKTGFVFGAIFVLLGLVSLFGYATKQSWLFSKRDGFVKRWGEQWGPKIHFFGYVVVPLAYGAYLIFVSA